MRHRWAPDRRATAAARCIDRGDNSMKAEHLRLSSEQTGVEDTLRWCRPILQLRQSQAVHSNDTSGSRANGANECQARRPSATLAQHRANFAHATRRFVPALARWLGPRRPDGGSPVQSQERRDNAGGVIAGQGAGCLACSSRWRARSGLGGSGGASQTPNVAIRLRRVLVMARLCAGVRAFVLLFRANRLLVSAKARVGTRQHHPLLWFRSG